MSKDEPTNGELKIMLDGLEKTVNRIESVGIDTNAKASATNGRVTKLEDAVKALTDIISTHDRALFDENGVVKSKDKILWSFTIFKWVYPGLLILVSTAFGFYVKDIVQKTVREETKDTPKEVVQILEEKYNLKLQNE